MIIKRLPFKDLNIGIPNQGRVFINRGSGLVLKNGGGEFRHQCTYDPYYGGPQHFQKTKRGIPHFGKPLYLPWSIKPCTVVRRFQVLSMAT